MVRRASAVVPVVRYGGRHARGVDAALGGSGRAGGRLSHTLPVSVGHQLGRGRIRCGTAARGLVSVSDGEIPVGYVAMVVHDALHQERHLVESRFRKAFGYPRLPGPLVRW